MFVLCLLRTKEGTIVEIMDMLDRLSIEQKKELISFLRALKEAECNQSPDAWREVTSRKEDL